MIRVGFALTGSFCAFDKAIKSMEELAAKGYDITPVMSFNSFALNTKFGEADFFKNKVKKICGKDIIHTIQDAEPIGPEKMFDVLLIEPCSGNTIAKIANGIVDTSVIMAVKSHLRNSRPVVVAVSTNDALGNAAKNIGLLLNMRNMYFVPMGQDNPFGKPRSVVADFSLTEQTLLFALKNEQIQPIIKSY